eukprot:1207060-Rhodomonas_salina.1
MAAKFAARAMALSAMRRATTPHTIQSRALSGVPYVGPAKILYTQPYSALPVAFDHHGVLYAC